MRTKKIIERRLSPLSDPSNKHLRSIRDLHHAQATNRFFSISVLVTAAIQSIEVDEPSIRYWLQSVAGHFGCARVNVDTIWRICPSPLKLGHYF